MQRPSPDALAAARAVARRNHDRAAQVRRLFVERPDTSNVTPLALMLRGGRGGQVRLKTYLSILWLASAPPHDVAYPSRAWATLLDLGDPAGRGARRITDATSWLESHHFITVESRPGHPNAITLLDESGTGRRYRVPGAAYNKAASRDAEPHILARHRYIQIPAAFWTSGWLAALSGAAVAMYLVLLTEQAGHSLGRELWFSPETARLRYVLSDDTRSTGLGELRRAGLVAVRRRPVATDIFDVQRFRNVYVLQPDRLTDVAEVPGPRQAHEVDSEAIAKKPQGKALRSRRAAPVPSVAARPRRKPA
jgi:hypothetical protein